MRPLFTTNFQGGFRVLKHKSHDRLPQSLVKTYNSLTSNCCQIFRLRTKSRIRQNLKVPNPTIEKISNWAKSRMVKIPNWKKSQSHKNCNFFFKKIKLFNGFMGILPSPPTPFFTAKTFELTNISFTVP